MKRSIATALIGALALAVNAPTSNAAVKPGAICKKIGQVSTSAGMKFTCIKSGKKIIWSKGVKISPPKPSSVAQPTPTPTTTASPSPTPTPTPQQPTIPKAPTSFDDLIDNYEGIAYAAWSKSRDKIRNSKRADISLKMVIGPKTTLINKEPIAAIDLVTRLYPGYIESAEIYLLAFGFEDRDWAVGQMESLIPNSGSGWIKDFACRTKETCWGGGAFYNGVNRFLIVETMEITNINTTSGSLEAHEFTHIVQQMNIKKARPAAEFIYDPWPPTWYWEGQANFTQRATIYSESFETYMRERRSASNGIINKPIFNSTHIQNYYVFNAPADWQKNYERWRQYDLGAMFVEVLVALKGPDATMEMWKIASTGVNFDIAFERVYGISYVKALPIMAKAIALQLGQS
jgi:hypothetical protein